MPIQIGARELVVIGGRALLTSADYRALAERFRAGDLQALLSPDLFRNVIFADEADLDHTALRMAEAGREFTPGSRVTPAVAPPSEEQSASAALAQEVEIELARVRAELEPKVEDPPADVFAEQIEEELARIRTELAPKVEELPADEFARQVEEELARMRADEPVTVEDSAASTLAKQVEEELARVRSRMEPAVPTIEEPPAPKPEPIPVRAKADTRRTFAGSVHGFIERLEATDPGRAYELILSESAELLNAERGSLLVYDESANDLALKAARGIPHAISELGRIPMGEGIAGMVLREGRAMVTTDISLLGRAPSPQARGYKTKSFLSYPIRIGDRRIGVLNLTDKRDGGSYDEIDLKIIESVGPQIALAVERAEWREKANQFQVMSLTDPLTGLHNRRYLEARLAEEVSRSKRHGHSTSFMMIDIDDFKYYNDHNGHQAGDLALQVTAQCLLSAVRNVDVAARYGGEEFSILMPETGLEEASVIADRIRRKIETAALPHGDRQPLGAVTLSIGLASFSTALDSPEKIIRAADRALYHAKRQGKNRAYAYRDAPAGNVSK